MVEYKSGQIMLTARGSAEGFLFCDGSALSRASYSTLFAAIGIIYGAGDGSTTFNIPNYVDRYLRGVDDGAGIDPDVATREDRGDGVTGDAVGTKQGSKIGDHYHYQYYTCGGDGYCGNAGAGVCLRGNTTTDGFDNVSVVPVNLSTKAFIKI